jgi:hypothetical protein
MSRHIARFLCLFLAASAAALAQSSLHTVEENGSRAARINIVFLSEGYTAADMPTFATHVATAKDYLFSREPWQQYRSYCNVYRIEIASNQSGTDNGAQGGMRDTYFNSGFTTPSVPQLLTVDSIGANRAFTLLNQHVPEYDQAIILVNDTKYGGAGGSLAVASVHSLSAQIVEHEVGHSFAGLADEYDIEYPSYTPAERPNVTQQTNRALIKWRDWIETSTPVPTPETAAYDSLVGLFEGAMYRTTDWYRPHNNSVMRNLGRPTGQVNRQQFVLSYYSRIRPIETFGPNNLNGAVTTFERLSFAVTPKSPSSGLPLQIAWKVDGQLQSGQTANTFSITSDELGNGNHTVTAEVRDPTPFVRTDPSSLLSEAVTWTRSLSNQLPPNLSAWRDAYGADLGNPARDGLVNLVKYALGIDPTKAATANQRPMQSITAVDGERYLTLSIPRRTRRTDVTTTAQVSSDYLRWHSGVGHTVVIQDSDNLLIVRDAVPISASGRRYMRLGVSAP